MSVLAVDTHGDRVVRPVRSVVRDGAIVRVKVCASCDKEKIVSDLRTVSEFSPNGRLKDGSPRGWRPLCKTCNAARVKGLNDLDREHRKALSRAHYDRKRKDPEWMAFKADQEAVTKRKKRATDPDFRENERRRSREWRRRKRREDPSYFSLARRTERKMVRASRFVAPVESHDVPRVDAQPFRMWLDVYSSNHGLNRVQLSRELGVTERRLYSVWSGEYGRVALDIVDRALLNARGSVRVDGRDIFTLDDLYPL